MRVSEFTPTFSFTYIFILNMISATASLLQDTVNKCVRHQHLSESLQDAHGIQTPSTLSPCCCSSNKAKFTPAAQGRRKGERAEDSRGKEGAESGEQE